MLPIFGSRVRTSVNKLREIDEDVQTQFIVTRLHVPIIPIVGAYASTRPASIFADHAVGASEKLVKLADILALMLQGVVP